MKINEKLIPGLKDKVDRYNIITNGEPVKTGRKIDGKDEYVKSFSFERNSGTSDISKPLGFVLSEVFITKIEGTELSNTNNWWNVNLGTEGAGNYNYSQNLRLMNNNTIVLSPNINFQKTYVEVYYYYKN